MAVSLITTIKRFVGLSTDAKPTGVPAGSTFLAYDTQTLYVTPDDGTTWILKGMPANNAVAVTTIDLKQAAQSYTLFTVTAQACLIDSLGIIIPADLSGEATFSGISIQSTDASPVVFLSETDGAKAKLNEAGKHIIWMGPDLVGDTEEIELTIKGGATGASQVCTVFASYRPVVAGGYLAV